MGAYVCGNERTQRDAPPLSHLLLVNYCHGGSSDGESGSSADASVLVLATWIIKKKKKKKKKKKPISSFLW